MTPYDHPSLASFTDLLMDAICVVDRDGYLRFISAAGERVFGYPAEEMVGRRILDFIYPQDLEKTQALIKKVLGGEPQLDFENRYLRKDGSIAHIMWSARWSEADGIRVGVARDVTERRRAESMRSALYAISEAATDSGDLATLLARIQPVIEGILPAAHFALALWDPHTGTVEFPYTTCSREGSAQLNLARAGSVCRRVIACRKPLILNRPTISKSSGFSCLGVPLLSGPDIIGALAIQSDVAGAVYRDQDQELLQFVGMQLMAARERLRMQARLEYMAQYDQLTGLPNRALFLDRLQTALARARRQHSRLALLFLDLNDFKSVNDTHGHSTGDRLLRAVASRLIQGLRDVDTAARMGGDEFVVLLDAVEQIGDAGLVADKLLASLSEPYELAELSLRSIPSIGWAVYPDHGADGDALIRHADDAMYRVKLGQR